MGAIAWRVAQGLGVRGIAGKGNKRPLYRNQMCEKAWTGGPFDQSTIVKDIE
jgi:hypothetical protein